MVFQEKQSIWDLHKFSWLGKKIKMQKDTNKGNIRKNFHCCKKQMDITRCFYEEAERTSWPKCMCKAENRVPEKSNGHPRSDSHAKILLYLESNQKG